MLKIEKPLGVVFVDEYRREQKFVEAAKVFKESQERDISTNI